MKTTSSSSRFVLAGVIPLDQSTNKRNHLMMIRENRFTKGATTGCSGPWPVAAPNCIQLINKKVTMVKATETDHEDQTTTSTPTTSWSPRNVNKRVETIERERPQDERNTIRNHIKGTQSFEEREGQEENGGLGAILKYPDEVYPMLKIAMAMKKAQSQIPQEAHWAFCYSMLNKVSKSFALLIQQLDNEYRNAVCIFYLVLRALDTIEDDMSIAADVKIPVLQTFHQHIYDRDWHFSCGTEDHKELMDGFHHVSAALMELGKSHQEAIEDTTKRVGAGMAKFLCKEVETIDDYDEYCHYASVLPAIGLSKIFGVEDLVPDSLASSIGSFFQKTTVIRDYLEDINETPKSRMYWPREIWSKYVNRLEDLKYEENSDKAVQCLNEMVTNALSHVEGSLEAISAVQNHAIFRTNAISQIMTMGILALCYNNVEVFRGEVKMRLGLVAVIFDQMSTMSDVYGANFDFAGMIKQKIDKTDPNATITLQRVEAIQKFCRDSGALDNRKLFIVRSKPSYSPLVVRSCEHFLPGKLWLYIHLCKSRWLTFIVFDSDDGDLHYIGILSHQFAK